MRFSLLTACGLIGMFTAIPAQATVQIDEAGTFFIYGDGRLRFEKDWDSYMAEEKKRASKRNIKAQDPSPMKK